MYNYCMKKGYINYFLLIGIFFLGLYLRLKGLDKPFGLGYDEAITYSDSIKGFPFEIIKTLVKTDVHMPLYFLILNLWIKMFSNSDIVMRLLSVLFGVLTIFFGYLSGKEVKNEKTGLITALLFSINSLAIYYSQEVRFYQLIILLSTVILLFFIKTVKNPTKKNILFLNLSAILLIYTNTISIIFVSILFIGLFIFLFFNYKDKIKDFLLFFWGGQFFLIPFYYLIYQISINHGSAFPQVLFFDSQVIFGIIQDWLSPVLVGLNNNPQNYLTNLFENMSIGLIIFVLIPVTISIILLLKNDFKKPVSILISSTVAIFILIEILESYLNKFTILPRYTLFVLPFVIILIAEGIENFKNKAFGYFLTVTLVIVNLIYLLMCPNSANKMQRISGQKIPANILKENNINKKDIVIYPIRNNLSDKYYQNGAMKLKMLQIFNESYPKRNSVLDEHSFYKKILQEENPKRFKKYFNTEIYKKLSPKGRLVIVTQEDFMPYTIKSFNYILENENIYKKQPILFMKLYKTTTDIIINSQKELKLYKIYKIDNWLIFIYEKD